MTLAALGGAAVLVFFTEVAFAFACDAEPCSASSDPMKMRALAWITLGGVLVSLVLAGRRRRAGLVISASLTAISFLLWLAAFTFVVEGDL